MQHSFNPDPVVCRDLFSGEESLYQIPRYQRPYSWEEFHIEQLVDDLYESWLEDRANPYYLGSVILVKELGDDRYDILDGQQRMTTLTIFYAIFNNRFKEHLGETNKSRVEGRIIDRDLEKARLRTDKQVDLEKSVLETLQTDQENRYTKAAEVLIEKIEDKFEGQKEDLDDFFKFVDQNVEMIKITSDNLARAVRLFQTINTRGKDLTVSDLTKSYLLSNLEDEEDKDDVIETWQEITGKIDDDYDLLDNILSMYRLYLREAKAEESVYEELKTEFAGENPKDIVRDIRSFVSEYMNIENTRDRWIFMLDNLTHELYWKTILITARKDGVGDYAELKKDLVAFYYAYWVGDYTAEKIKIPSVNVLQMLKDDTEFSDIEDYLEHKAESDSIVSRVRDSLNDENVYEERWHKRLLIAIEYLMSTPQKIEKIDPGKDLHREHVLPKRFQSAKLTHDYWGDQFEDVEAERLKNTLGNLVPLQYDLNSSAAQNPFSEKVKIYKGEGDKPRSSFDLTLRVADSENYTEWSPEAIQDYKNFLLEKAAKLMHLPAEELKANEQAS